MFLCKNGHEKSCFSRTKNFIDYFRSASHGFNIFREILADQFITQRRDTYRKIMREFGAKPE